MPSTTLNEFITDCETLLARQGVPSTVALNGVFGVQVRAVDTPGLFVAGAPLGELEILLRYRTEDGKELTNPVVCRDADGRLYRTHGEWQFGRRRVQRLLAGEKPTTPIRLGKNETGWTDGLD